MRQAARGKSVAPADTAGRGTHDGGRAWRCIDEDQDKRAVLKGVALAPD